MKTLPAGSLKGTQFARQAWFAVVPNDTTVDDILKPGFYAHFASDPPVIKQHAVIELVTQDGLLDVELRVVKVERGLVFVRALRITEAEGRAQVLKELAEPTAPVEGDALPEVPAEYKVGFAPGNKLYYVQLKATGQMLINGLTKRKAHEFAIEHAKKAGALAAA